MDVFIVWATFDNTKQFITVAQSEEKGKKIIEKLLDENPNMKFILTKENQTDFLKNNIT